MIVTETIKIQVAIEEDNECRMGLCIPGKSWVFVYFNGDGETIKKETAKFCRMVLNKQMLETQLLCAAFDKL